MADAIVNAVAKFLRIRYRLMFAEKTAFKNGDITELNRLRCSQNALTNLVGSLECVYGSKEVRQVFKAMSNRKDQRKRLKRRIKGMVEAYTATYVKFITFTMDDEHLNRISVTTFKRRVSEFLNTHAKEYVYNVDYGTLNERLHIHAIVGFVSKPDYKALASAWTYGALNFKSFRDTKNSATRIATYMNKLSNHSTKWTATDLTYSRIPRDKDGFIELSDTDELPF